MQQLQWNIVAAKPGEVGILGSRMEDTQNPNSPWPFFFTGISADRYPAVITAAVQETGSAGQYAGVLFPTDLDEADITERGASLPPDVVAVYPSHWGETLMPRVLFYTMLQAFAGRLLASPGQPAYLVRGDARSPGQAAG